MATYEITDSVLKRHYEQHMAAGGNPLADKLERSGISGAQLAAGATAAAGAAAAAGTAAAASAASTVSSQASAAVDSASSAATNATSGSFGMSKIIPLLLGAALLGWLGFKYFGGNAEVPDVAVPDVSMPDVGAVGDDLKGMFGSATSSLESITDAESASAALPALTEAGSKLDGLSETFGKLPDAARGPLAGIVSEGLAKFQPIVDKVMALPGVGDILKPVIEPIMEKLAAMAG